MPGDRAHLDAAYELANPNGANERRASGRIEIDTLGGNFGNEGRVAVGFEIGAGLSQWEAESGAAETRAEVADYVDLICVLPVLA
jgi:hypothetical protein